MLLCCSGKPERKDTVQQYKLCLPTDDPDVFTCLYRIVLLDITVAIRRPSGDLALLLPFAANQAMYMREAGLGIYVVPETFHMTTDDANNGAGHPWETKSDKKAQVM